MIRKSFLDKNSISYGQGKYKVAEDLDLYINMQINGARFGNVNCEVLRYRELNMSLSRINKSSIKEETLAMQKEFFLKNKEHLEFFIQKLPVKLNEEECSIVFRYVLSYIKKLDFSHIRLLKNINLKIILSTLFSEINR